MPIKKRNQFSLSNKQHHGHRRHRHRQLVEEEYVQHMTLQKTEETQCYVRTYVVCTSYVGACVVTR